MKFLAEFSYHQDPAHHPQQLSHQIGHNESSNNSIKHTRAQMYGKHKPLFPLLKAELAATAVDAGIGACLSKCANIVNTEHKTKTDSRHQTASKPSINLLDVQ